MLLPFLEDPEACQLSWDENARAGIRKVLVCPWQNGQLHPPGRILEFDTKGRLRLEILSQGKQTAARKFVYQTDGRIDRILRFFPGMQGNSATEFIWENQRLWGMRIHNSGTALYKFWFTRAGKPEARVLLGNTGLRRPGSGNFEKIEHDTAGLRSTETAYLNGQPVLKRSFAYQIHEGKSLLSRMTESGKRSAETQFIYRNDGFPAFSSISSPAGRQESAYLYLT